MAGIAMAESTKKRTPKTLDHLEIHAQLGGGHIVKHVYTGYEHDSKDVKFNEEGKTQGGEHIQSHLDKNAGLPPMTGKEGAGGETEDEGE
jgi:hypothetical protein